MDSPIYRGAVALSRLLSWLFTDSWGLASLALLAFVLLILRLGSAVKAARNLEAAAGRKAGPLTGAGAALSEAASLAAWAAANVPSLLMTAAVLAIVAAVSGSVAKFDDFMAGQKKIKAYEKVVANLERRYRLARVECLQADGSALSLRLGYYDAEGKDILSTQDISLPGREVFFDAVVLNFAYSGIESGAARNLALPRCAFTDLVAEKDGVPLAASDGSGPPYVFRRTEDQVYGMEKADFDKRLAELLELAADGAKARKAGVVRSLYGSAVHRAARKGDSFTIWVEQSGGLTIKGDSF